MNANSLLRRVAVLGCCLAVWALTASFAAAQSIDNDQIKVIGSKRQVPGKVTQTSPTEVTYDTTASGSKTIAANEVDWIIFFDSPAELREARKAIFEQNGNFASAKVNLDKINMASVSREPVKQDIEFYKALTATRLAQAGQPSGLNAAATQMMAFVKSSPNSYHYFEANEILGELALALGKYENAAGFYAEIAKAPWPDMKAEASVNLGRVLLALSRPDEAIKNFDTVLTAKGQGKAFDEQVQLASIGKAECLAKTGETAATSIKTIEDALAKAPPDDRDVMAWGYNALGNCYSKMNRKKDALLAYLHVDLLFSTVPEAHAESLYHLAQLWAGEKPDRAAQAKQTLKQRYPNSPWTKKLDQSGAT